MQILNLSNVTAMKEGDARKYLEEIRWPDGAVCPHCGSKEVTELQGKSTTPGTWKCKVKDCRKKFTVRVGTIFESSHITLRHWVMVFHLMCSSKKGVSAHQIHRSIGVTYKTAWFMCHRVRHAMKEGAFDKLDGIVEADETYVGGKQRRRDGKNGRLPDSEDNKVPVVALVQRNGDVRATVVANVTADNLREHLETHAEKTSTLMTDERASYTTIGKEFSQHGVIKHRQKQYAKGDVTTNTIEGFFGIFKRGVYGIWHRLSDRHLPKYVDEAQFRYNRRKSTDGARTIMAIQGAEGKRLMYR